MAMYKLQYKICRSCKLALCKIMSIVNSLQLQYKKYDNNEPQDEKIQYQCIACSKINKFQICGSCGQDIVRKIKQFKRHYRI